MSDAGYVPVQAAVIYGSLYECKKLISEGADMTVKTNEKWMLLHIAAHQRGTEMLDWVWTEGAKVVLSIDDKTGDGYTALVITVANNKLENCIWLLKHGADITFRMNDGRSLIDSSCQGSSIALFDWILTEGMKAGLSIENIDGHGYTPLLSSVAAGKLDNVKLLVARGAGLRARANIGINVIHAARLENHSFVLEYLIDAVLKELFNEKDESGLTPLQVCTRLSRKDFARLLITKAVQLKKEADEKVKAKVEAKEQAKKQAKTALKLANAKPVKICCGCTIEETEHRALIQCICEEDWFCSQECMLANWAVHKADCMKRKAAMKRAKGMNICDCCGNTFDFVIKSCVRTGSDIAATPLVGRSTGRSVCCGG